MSFFLGLGRSDALRDGVGIVLRSFAVVSRTPFVALVSCILMGAAFAQGWGQANRTFVVQVFRVEAACPTQERFEEWIQEAIEGVSVASGKSIDVELWVTREDSGFRMRLVTHGLAGQGERLLRDATCRNLIAAAAAVVSLAIESSTIYEDEAVPAKTEPSPVTQKWDDEEPGQPATRAIRRQESLREQRETDRFVQGFIGGGLSADWGTLPAGAVGKSLFVGLQSRSYRVEFSVVSWDEQERLVGRFGDKGGRFDFLSGELALCRVVLRWPMPAGLCAKASVGRLNAYAVDLFEPIDQTHITGTLGAGMFAEAPVTSWSRFRASLGLGVHVVRPRYTIEILAPDIPPAPARIHVHQPEPIFARISVGWVASF